jgi:cytochrome c551/c552
MRETHHLHSIPGATAAAALVVSLQVAAKYAGDAGAQALLEQKVKAGGSGVWGAIPMPPNNVPDADLEALVQSILATN